jgi:RimJ/RimL family protein N-acetyltransferase
MRASGATSATGHDPRGVAGHPLAGHDPLDLAISGRPPETIVNGPVELRRHSASDRDALVDAVNRSLDELRPWMPWAQTPATAASIAGFLEGSRRAWAAGLEFGYSIRAAEKSDGPGSDDVIGACGLHFRSDPGVAQIGYWVRTDRARSGVATAAAGALTRAALDLTEVLRIEIHCDAENRASRAVARKIGYYLERIDPRPSSPRAPGETDQLMIWVYPG